MTLAAHIAGRLDITNVVAIGRIAKAFDLDAIAKASPGLYLVGRRIPGRLSFFLQRPRGSATLYRSGKLLITGVQDPDYIPAAAAAAVEVLEAAGVPLLASRRVEIVNIAAKYVIGRGVNLSRLAGEIRTGEIEYDPELFHGLVYRPEGAPGTAMIFNTGAAILVGVRDREGLARTAVAVDRLVAHDR